LCLAFAADANGVVKKTFGVPALFSGYQQGQPANGTWINTWYTTC
jgi:hydrogenase/urease accessory protein HupE